MNHETLRILIDMGLITSTEADILAGCRYSSAVEVLAGSEYASENGELKINKPLNITELKQLVLLENILCDCLHCAEPQKETEVALLLLLVCRFIWQVKDTTGIATGAITNLLEQFIMLRDTIVADATDLYHAEINNTIASIRQHTH